MQGCSWIKACQCKEKIVKIEKKSNPILKCKLGTGLGRDMLTSIFHEYYIYNVRSVQEHYQVSEISAIFGTPRCSQTPY
eukprot:1149398-Pelagomonas_calceolata.AAC.1